MSFYRSLSLNRAYHVERGSSLARFHWSAVTAGWSRTPSVASAALCHASPTWVAHRSESGRCVRTFFITDFSSDVQAQTCYFHHHSANSLPHFLCVSRVYLQTTSPTHRPWFLLLWSTVSMRSNKGACMRWVVFSCPNMLKCESLLKLRRRAVTRIFQFVAGKLNLFLYDCATVSSCCCFVLLLSHFLHAPMPDSFMSAVFKCLQRKCQFFSPFFFDIVGKVGFKEVLWQFKKTQLYTKYKARARRVLA